MFYSDRFPLSQENDYVEWRRGRTAFEPRFSRGLFSGRVFEHLTKCGWGQVPSANLQKGDGVESILLEAVSKPWIREKPTSQSERQTGSLPPQGFETAAKRSSSRTTCETHF